MKSTVWLVFSDRLSAGLVAGAVSFCMALSLAPAATVYEVDPNNGDDSGGSDGKHFSSIHKAADKLNAGDTCLIHKGAYHESVTVWQSGTAKNPITFVTAGDGEVVIDGADIVDEYYGMRHAGIYKVDIGKNVEL